MYQRLCVFVVLVGCLAMAAPAAAHHPRHVATDEPAEPPQRGWLAQTTPTPVERPSIRAAAKAAPAAQVDLELLGSLALAPGGVEAHADVAGYSRVVRAPGAAPVRQNFAFVGKWRQRCPGTGVDVIDISNPRFPLKLSDTADHPDTSMEDMQAMRIGDRDVMVTGLQDCNADPSVEGATGLEVHDITDPANPEVLAFFPTQAGGVHELDLTRTPDGRVLALLAVPDLEALTADEDARGGTGDMIVVDLSNPARPVQISEYGILDDSRFGLETYLDVGQGGDARAYLHSVRANADGTRAYLSYWDAGVITLDISNPAQPRVLGRTGYEPGEEGNAHSVDEARGGNILVQADEDFSPFEITFESSAFEGARSAVEAQFSLPLTESPGRRLAGEVVSVGRGCPANSFPTPPAAPNAPADNPEDPYSADPRGKIALIERGACAFTLKAARAVRAGATAVVIYNSAAFGDALALPGGVSPVVLPDGTRVDIDVPVLFVARSTGLALATAGSTIAASAEFNGWGFLRIWDNRDPEEPRQLSTFATPNTFNAGLATQGIYSVHNPEVVGNRMYVSWYNDGIRVVDISRPSAPREQGAWVGEGRPAGAPPVDIWSVVPFRGLLLASDRNHGLYILRRGN